MDTRPIAPFGTTLSLLTCLLVLALSGCAPTSFLITPVSREMQLVEFEVRRDSFFATQKVVIVDVEGVLTDTRARSLLGGEGDNPTAIFKEKLDRAAADPLARAVVLRINSPGGGVTASDLMHGQIRRFRTDHGKPVIACMMDTAASGGYYIACAADRIFAQPTTVTGSIGVISIFPDLSGAMKKLGIGVNVVKSGPLKDAGSPFRDMNETDRRVFTDMIASMYERFLDVVCAGRPGLSRDRLRELADGRVYLAPEAKSVGLIDEIGSLDDAIAAARRAAGLGDRAIVVVQYARSFQHRPNYLATSPANSPSVNLIHVDLPDWLATGSPQFMYLWAPGW